MEAVKDIPYGLSNFEQARKQNAYYVDKTMYLPMLEQTANYLFLIRPRRFGKSLFVSMMRAYYDLSMAGRFDELFGGLWIHEHPTKLKNAFQMIYFDFSRIGGESFNRYCGQVLDAFADKYASFYNEEFVRTLKAEPDAGGKLNYIGLQAELRGYPLYLIIDEYDNFTNVILSEGGKEMFRKLTHASGFLPDRRVARDPGRPVQRLQHRLEHLAGSALQRHAGIFGNGCPRHVPLLPRTREAACGCGHRSHDGGDEAVVQQLLLLQKTH